MKHADDLSTYSLGELKDMAKNTLRQYRKDQPDKKFTLEKDNPFYIRVTKNGTQLVINIKDCDNWVRTHDIML